MEIPQNIQDKIKCSECDELLSCGPVYLKHKTGGTICGRYGHPDETESNEGNDRTRMDPYEAIASLFLFPCAFAPKGCREKVAFTLGQSAHESSCGFRPLVCPVVERGSCNWVGSHLTLREHCRVAHPEHLIENEALLLPTPDLTRSHLVNYIISRFDLLFLLHLKISVSTAKLYYSVRLFNPTQLLDNFTYSLKIKGSKNIIQSNETSILPTGVLALEEHSSMSIGINTLLDNLGGNFADLQFSLTIRS